MDVYGFQNEHKIKIFSLSLSRSLKNLIKTNKKYLFFFWLKEN